ncbi:hypothetical protein DET49_113133 [Salegentibacter sp. 24]|nr:hypothetical protein DET49_113133 [Salegentibacter sp. 24]
MNYETNDYLTKSYLEEDFSNEIVTSFTRAGSLLGLCSFQTNGKYFESAYTLEITQLMRISYKRFNQTLSENHILLRVIAQLLFNKVVVLKISIIKNGLRWCNGKNDIYFITVC